MPPTFPIPNSSLLTFGARYYHSALSLWLSADPLADKYPNLSPYAYCADNPVGNFDPDGREIGNYYDISGNYLGSDGENDREVYIVTGQSDIEKIKGNNTSDGFTPVSEVNSAMRLPLFETRQEINRQLQQGNENNNFAEYGGIYGIDLRTNQESARPAEEGPSCNPSINNSIASIDYNTVDMDWFQKSGTYHSHPSGEINGCFFTQTPSATDYNNACNNSTRFNMTGTCMVFGMKNGKVYLYNSRNNRAEIFILTFLDLK